MRIQEGISIVSYSCPEPTDGPKSRSHDLEIDVGHDAGKIAGWVFRLQSGHELGDGPDRGIFIP